MSAPRLRHLLDVPDRVQEKVLPRSGDVLECREHRQVSTADQAKGCGRQFTRNEELGFAHDIEPADVALARTWECSLKRPRPRFVRLTRYNRTKFNSGGSSSRSCPNCSPRHSVCIL